MDASTPARVEVEGLSKVFRGPKHKQIKAVDDVSFTAHAGEIFGLLGANGAGKTTTLRVLSTMLSPTAGDARLCGFSVVRRPEEVRRRIGFLSTATSLYGRLTAREMVIYFGRLHGMAPAALEARRQELFELFGMQSFADVRCDKLSTGMKQKVSIVRSVLHDPEVMIFDEPTAGLDVLT
ncbi:MAG TPA: ATP-binding cassette domain-containing protein, partial [Myxococcota bacterium]|nr:ATP-binding cassette domain-containing protein [Myxococcota bacterium]